MPEAYAGFIDAGFLHAEGARKLGHSRSDTSLNAEEIVAWFRRLVNHRLIGEREEFLRAYWYDGAFEHSHPGYANQLRYFDAIASTPRIQLRLGHIAERQSPLERPIRSALDNTAQGLGIEPGLLRQEFNRHDFSSAATAERSGYLDRAGYGAPGQSFGLHHCYPGIR